MKAHKVKIASNLNLRHINNNMSSNNNQSTNKNNTNILDQARNFLHNAVQTPEEKEKIEQGKKTVDERLVDKFTDLPKGQSQDNKTNVENKESSNEFLQGVQDTVETGRKKVYNATMSEEEKKLKEEADKTILEKARSDAASTTNQILGTSASQTDNKSNEDKTAPPEDKGPIQQATDAIGSAVNGTKDAVGGAANSTKEGIGSTLENVSSKVGSTTETVKEKVADTFGWKKAEDEPQQESINKVPENNMVEGMVHLGEKVQETAGSVFEDAKNKFDERLKEDSVTETVKESNKESKN